MLRNRSWAELASPVYAGAATAALVLALLASRLGRAMLLRARIALALLALVGAVAIPLALEAQWRTEPTRAPANALHPYGASELVVTEGAANAVVHGRDPYSTEFTSPELDGRSPSTGEHFPYLPGMIAFGIPRALVPGTPWSDARFFFLVATLVAAAFALRGWHAPPGHRLRALQVLIVLPTGAAALATGGDDVPVLALCLLALVLFDRGRHAGSAVAAAGAALLKLTAWPLLVVLAVPSRRVRVALGSVGAVALLAAAAGPSDFVDDVLLFPTGLTRLPSPASTTTLGSMMIAPVQESPYRVLITLALFAVALVVTVLVLREVAARRAIGAPEAAAAAALVLLTLILLAPVARAGYLVYPLDLLVWAALLRSARFEEVTTT
jgi:hypothetical protein